MKDSPQEWGDSPQEKINWKIPAFVPSETVIFMTLLHGKYGFFLIRRHECMSLPHVALQSDVRKPEGFVFFFI